MGFDMNYKIKVANEVESKEAQELFFELDYSWPSSGKNLKNLNYRYLILLKKGSINWNTKEQFLECDAKEITLPELRDLVVLKRNDRNDRTHTDQDNWSWYISSNGTGYVFGAGNANGLHQWDESSLDMVDLKPIEEKEVKEYLIKINGAYKLCGLLEDDVTDEYIEIPEGSVKAYLNRSGTINFVNADDDYMNGVTHGEWVDTHRGRHESSGHQLVWQRESPNDKLASAEQYRQAEVLPFIDDEPDFKKLADLLVETTKHKPAAREWDLSDYDFAESDDWIESNVEQTLSERESQYGSFLSVANTTGGLMGVLLNSKNGQTMPYAHQEALHMICSKMARIVNGDFNHKDSWHDIGGYAKLIENLIEVEDEKTK